MTNNKTDLGDLLESVELGVRVGEANVVQADIEAGNGVIHVIDKVIMPPM